MTIFNKSYWRYVFSWKKLISLILSIIGAAWLLIEVVAFFMPAAENCIRDNWWLLIPVIILIVICRFWPTLKISKKLHDKDINISIVVGDIINDAKYADLIIPFNTSFDVDVTNGIISPYSVQGQFTAKYYNNSVRHLNVDIESANTCLDKTDRPQKTKGNKYQYPIGTVVKINIPNSTNRVAYFTCIANMNDNANAESSIQYIQSSLMNLWMRVKAEGELSDIAIPILGSGRSRLNTPREDLIFEIIDSFIIYNSDHKIADSLTIYIWEKDLNIHNLDFNRICQYLNYKTSFIRNAHTKIEGEQQM